jgi:putative phosphoesterase
LKVAALYDVHGMTWALEAVLAEVGEVDCVLLGGDLLRGAYPDQVVARTRELDAIHVRGNCDRTPTDWDRERVSEDDLAWLASLPMTASIDGVLYCHSTPRDDMPITTVFTPDALLEQRFGGFDEKTFVIGHTHHQFDRRAGDLRIVNAGSVGMPYEGEVAAFWALVDDGEPQFRKTTFDVDRAVAELRASGWPEAEQFIAENVLVPVPRDEAAAMFEAQNG